MARDASRAVFTQSRDAERPAISNCLRFFAARFVGADRSKGRHSRGAELTLQVSWYARFAMELDRVASRPYKDGT